MSSSSARDEVGKGGGDVSSGEEGIESQGHQVSHMHPATKTSLLLAFPPNTPPTTTRETDKTHPPLSPHNGSNSNGNNDKLRVRKDRVFDDVVTSLSSSSSCFSSREGREEVGDEKRGERILEAGEDGRVVAADGSLAVVRPPVACAEVILQTAEDKGAEMRELSAAMMSHITKTPSTTHVALPKTAMAPILFNTPSVAPACNAATPLPVKDYHSEGKHVSRKYLDGGHFSNYCTQCGAAQPGNVNGGATKSFDQRFEEFYDWWRGVDTYTAVMLAATFTAFALTIIALPLPQLDMMNGPCYTYWGYKGDCDAHVYDNRTEFIICSPIRTRLHAGAAFSSTTVVCLFFALCCGALLLRENDNNNNASQPKIRIAMLVFLSIAFLLQMVSWALIVDIFVSRYCEDKLLSRNTAYGVAFGMSVTSWLLLVVGVLAGVLGHLR